jgi:serine/threonine protein kinase
MEGTILHERWVVDKQIGISGQSTTYKAYSTENKSECNVVIKFFNDRQPTERAIQEIIVLSKNPHNNIVKYIDSDVTESPIWLATKYYAAGNLAENPTHFSSDFKLITKRFRDILAGISHLHSRNPQIIHRDIKPENFLLNSSDGTTVVSDFGICFIPGTERFTHTNEPVGARNFMAPEHEIGRWSEISTSSDVYSLGKLLYWMLSGKALWREEYRSEGYNLVTLLKTSELEHFNNLFDRMICVDPKARYADAKEVSVAFENVVRLIEGSFNPTNWKIEQKCRYCGNGHYKSDRQSHPFSSSQWRVVVCDNCGNTQIFKLRTDVQTGKDPNFPGWR